MKIFHVITSLSDGGAEATLFRLIENTYQDVEHIVVSLMKPSKYSQKIESFGVRVLYLNFPRGRFNISGLNVLYSELKKEQPDVVQTWMYHANLIGGFLARLSGCKEIHWGIHHSNLDRKNNSLSTLIAAKLGAFFSKIIPSRIVFVAEEAIKSHVNIGYRGKFILIPNGYDIDRFSPNARSRKRIRNALNIKDENILLGFVARFEPIKDHNNLLSALSIVCENNKNIICLLIGKNCDVKNAELVKKICMFNLQKNIRLLGQRKNIPAIMNALDLHVLSSSGEAFPNVLAEAMACGTPCVSTDVGDASLIIGELGWIVPPSDSGKLASALISAIESMTFSEEWKERKNSCTLKIENTYSLNRMVDKYLDCWIDKVVYKR